MKTLKKVPMLKSENEEREFWSSHDSTEYVDWSKAQAAVFPTLMKVYLNESVERDSKGWSEVAW